jgi:hypothetical protein
MNDNEKYQMDMMTLSIDQCKAAIKIASDGKAEMVDELKQYEDYLKEILEAKQNLKNSDAVVAMFEYAVIKKEIDLCRTFIRQHELKINNVDNLIRDKNKEILSLTEKLNIFSKSLERGKVIQFRGKNG